MGQLCVYCIGERGVTGKDIIEGDDAFMDHIEREHHIPVRRKGETVAETMRRFKAANPEAGGPNCRCPTCGDTRDADAADFRRRVLEAR